MMERQSATNTAIDGVSMPTPKRRQAGEATNHDAGCDGSDEHGPEGQRRHAIHGPGKQQRGVGEAIGEDQERGDEACGEVPDQPERLGGGA